MEFAGGVHRRESVGDNQRAAPASPGVPGQPGEQLTFSVIVPYRNEASHIAACCESLQRQTIRRERYELLFVDNGSTDGTTGAIRGGPGTTVMREEKPGAYVARNAAIRSAKGRFLAFTDADCVAEPDWLEQAQEALHATGAAVAVGRRVCPPGSPRGLRLLQIYEDAKLELLPQLPSRFAFGICGNMVIRADVMRRVGPFDEWQRAADTAYIHRVIQCDPAHRVVFWPAMCVTHLGDHTTGQALRKMFVYGASNTRAARDGGYAPLESDHRWELWRACCRDPRCRARDRLYLFSLLVSGGMLYKTGEWKGRLGW